MPKQKLPALKLSGADGARSKAAVLLVHPQSFEDGNRRMHRSMGCASRPPAVPASILHLLSEQVSGDRVQPLVLVVKVAQDRENHSGDTGFRLTGAVIDPAIGANPLVE